MKYVASFLNIKRLEKCVHLHNSSTSLIFQSKNKFYNLKKKNSTLFSLKLSVKFLCLTHSQEITTNEKEQEKQTLFTELNNITELNIFTDIKLIFLHSLNKYLYMSVLFKILSILQNAYNRGDIHIHTHTYLWTIEKVGHQRIDAF